MKILKTLFKMFIIIGCIALGLSLLMGLWYGLGSVFIYLTPKDTGFEERMGGAIGVGVWAFSCICILIAIVGGLWKGASRLNIRWIDSLFTKKEK
ncbi:MAG: hypothetical protein GY679_01895 [Mycoplasma sp.]|nr:hypothetical protein [Mycoplasma sp.]